MIAGATTARLHVPTAGGLTFCAFHAASKELARDTAVLFCPPFGWEDFCSYRARRSWAMHLAAGGYATARIDLPATGDSGGSPRASRGMDGWVDGIGGAASWLRELTGARRVVAIGISLGGLVAVRASAVGAPIDDLVLWAVPAKGRLLLRELRAFAMLYAEVDPADAATEPNPAASEVPPTQPADGSLEVGGFLLSAETVADLESTDLAELSGLAAVGAERRVLMLERDGLGVDRRLRAALESAGATVSVAPGAGYTAMMAHPQQARAPLAEFAVLDEWLAAGASMGAAASAPPQPSSGGAQIDVGEALVSESSFVIARDFGELAGVLTLPEGEPASDFCAVLLNAGALRRIGPGRMWVDLARDWAARGVPTLRIDLEGIGDSDGDPTPYTDTAALYVPRLVDQAIASLDELERRGLGPRFLLAGLCSGAYWSFQAALADPRVAAVFLINPRALFWDRSIEKARDARRVGNVLRPAAWRRLIADEAPLATVGRITRAAAGATLRARSLAEAGRLRGTRIEEALASLSARDVRVLLAFGSGEPLYDELAAEGRLEAIAATPGVELARLPGSDHTLRPIRLQRHARDLLRAALDRQLGGLPPRSGEARRRT